MDTNRSINFSISMNWDLMDRFTKHCEERLTPRSKVIARLVKEYLEEQEEDEQETEEV